MIMLRMNVIGCIMFTMNLLNQVERGPTNYKICSYYVVKFCRLRGGCEIANGSHVADPYSAVPDLSPIKDTGPVYVSSTESPMKMFFGSPSNPWTLDQLQKMNRTALIGILRRQGNFTCQRLKKSDLIDQVIKTQTSSAAMSRFQDTYGCTSPYLIDRVSQTQHSAAALCFQDTYGDTSPRALVRASDFKHRDRTIEANPHIAGEIVKTSDKAGASTQSDSLGKGAGPVSARLCISG